MTATAPSTESPPIEAAPPVCTCWACSHPSADNHGVRALHKSCHLEFEAFWARRQPMHFAMPSRLQVVQWQAAEHRPDALSCAEDLLGLEIRASGRCTLPEHAMHPSHPAAH